MSSKNIFLKFFQGNQPKGASGRRVVGERGSNDLPPGKKGGETMTPDRHYEHKQHAFDSFCKKVLKCEAYNGYLVACPHYNSKRSKICEDMGAKNAE